MQFVPALYLDDVCVWDGRVDSYNNEVHSCREVLSVKLYTTYLRTAAKVLEAAKADWKLGVIAVWPGDVKAKAQSLAKKALGRLATIQFISNDTRQELWDDQPSGQLNNEAHIIFHPAVKHKPYLIGGALGIVRDIIDPASLIFGSNPYVYIKPIYPLFEKLNSYSLRAPANPIQPTCQNILMCNEIPFYEWLVFRSNWADTTPEHNYFDFANIISNESRFNFHGYYHDKGFWLPEFQEWAGKKYPEWTENMNMINKPRPDVQNTCPMCGYVHN